MYSTEQSNEAYKQNALQQLEALQREHPETYKNALETAINSARIVFDLTYLYNKRAITEGTLEAGVGLEMHSMVVKANNPLNPNPEIITAYDLCIQAVAYTVPEQAKAELQALLDK